MLKPPYFPIITPKNDDLNQDGNPVDILNSLADENDKSYMSFSNLSVSKKKPKNIV
jgi:hypothetical protein